MLPQLDFDNERNAQVKEADMLKLRNALQYFYLPKPG